MAPVRPQNLIHEHFSALGKVLFFIASLFLIFTACNNQNERSELQSAMMQKYGVNKRVVGTYNQELSVTCLNGIFLGLNNDSVLEFKGIPYAKQPVGKLRWKEPQAPDTSRNVFEAYYFGKSCIQSHGLRQRASFYKQGEDCLTLNVYKSLEDTSRMRPVMVYIHGGSYSSGGTSDPMFDGHNFIKAHPEIIMVTINYRLGIYGFIDFSSVKGSQGYENSCNLGLLDQVSALQWIKSNIASFGGDPDNVTIFGESAGAGSVSLLCILPQARGLFQKAICESGSIALTYGKGECQSLTQHLMKESGATCMQDLLSLSETRLKELNGRLSNYTCFPMRDGRILPKDLFAAYQSGASGNISMLIGTNADEVRFWIKSIGGMEKFKLFMPIMYENNLKRVSKQDINSVNQFMASQNRDKIWKMAEFYNDVMFRVPAILQAEAVSKNGSKAFMYYWKYPSAYANCGAYHTVELAYVFNNLQETIYTGNNVNKDLAVQVQNMWVNFAKNGNPSIKGLKWPEYDETNRYTMVLDTTSRVQSDILSIQRKAIMPLLKYHFNGNYLNLSLAVPQVYKIVAVLAVCLIAVVAFLILFIRARIKKCRQSDVACKHKS